MWTTPRHHLNSKCCAELKPIHLFSLSSEQRRHLNTWQSSARRCRKSAEQCQCQQLYGSAHRRVLHSINYPNRSFWCGSFHQNDKKSFSSLLNTQTMTRMTMQSLKHITPLSISSALSLHSLTFLMSLLRMIEVEEIFFLYGHTNINVTRYWYKYASKKKNICIILYDNFFLKIAALWTLKICNDYQLGVQYSSFAFRWLPV